MTLVKLAFCCKAIRDKYWKLFVLLVMTLALAGCDRNAQDLKQALPSGEVKAKSPNILWIIADDLSPDLGFNGNPAISTPNIDKLASEGVYFDRAYTTAPVCSASRSALMTGRYASSIGAHSHRLSEAEKKPLPERIKAISEYMKEQGYFITNGDDDLSEIGKTDYNFQIAEDFFDSPNWTDRAPGQPFFAQVNFEEPHRDFYQNEDPERAAKIELPPYEIDHEITRADWANYFHTIEVMDDKVGAILTMLEEQGLADSTIVFFFSDHGRPHLRDKQWLYDGGLRVPLIVRWPGKLEAGTVDERPLNLIDVGAASLALTGVALPDYMHAVDMFSDKFEGREYIYGARDRSGNVIDRIRSVQKGDVKLIKNYLPEKPYMQGQEESYYKRLQYPAHTLTILMHRDGELDEHQSRLMASERPPEEFYDLSVDPYELNNVIDDPKYRDVIEELRIKLADWVEMTDGAGYYELIPRDQNALAKRSEQWGLDKLKQRGIEGNDQREEELVWWRKELKLDP